MEHAALFLSSSAVESSRMIHTPSAFARSSLFHLQETGTLRALCPHKSQRSGLNSYLFFTVLSGSGRLEYDGKTYELQSGDCVFIDCRKPYTHMTGNDLWELQWAHFYGPNMNAVYEKYLERGGRPVFHPQKTQRYRSVLDTLYEVASSVDYVRDMKIQNVLSKLLVLLMEDGWNPRESAWQSRTRVDIQEVKDYLDAHYREKITLDQLASLFYINKYYLLERFKGRYGSSVIEYVIHKRITEGKRLLRFSDKTVEEISEACGMSPHYFARQFKQHEGITPGEYRRAWENKSAENTSDE